MPLLSCQRRAFTLVELLSTIAILAALIVVALGSYVAITDWVRQTSDKQTLTVLNDALDRYKTQGGNINALTAGTPITTVLTRLSTPVSWSGFTHQFLNTGKTYPSRSLDVKGNRHDFTFYRFNTYSTGTPGFGVPVAGMPYGSGMGYAAAGGNPAACNGVSDTGYIAVQPSDGDLYITDSYFELGSGVSATFWACADSNDSTPAGVIQVLAFTANPGFASVDVSGLRSLTQLDLSSNSDLTSLNISGITTLTEIHLTETGLASLTLQDLPDLTVLNTGGISSLESLSVSNCPQVATLNVWGSSLSSLSISNMPALATVDVTSGSCSDAELDAIFTALPTVSSGTIYVGGNPGSDDCDPSIAEAKGWTVDTVST